MKMLPPMKKFILSIFVFCLFSFAYAQNENTHRPDVTLKWAPAGLAVGSINVQGEYNFGGKGSLTAQIGVPMNSHHVIQYQNNDARFNLKATSFMAGYRMYLSKKHLKGLYFEPYAKYIHHAGDGTGITTLDNKDVQMNFTNHYNGLGVGAQLGAQFIISKRVVIDLYLLGPEINSSSNNFKATETTNTLYWNEIEAQDAEKYILDFIDQVPFIRNNTKVTVDKNNRTVTADFKGALPGFRAGISFGIAL
jgi:hypothetical protein